jgi:predicted nucleotidyltransferase
MGVKIPGMGTTGELPRTAADTPLPRVAEGPSLADALFTATQQRVLGLLFGQPDRSFSLSELVRLARSGTGAVQREVARLAHTGIITSTQVDGRKRLQANPASPIFEELRGLIEKTTGVQAKLREALAPHAHRVRLALLYGSIAKQTDVSSSDIDVLLVSDELTQEEAFALFEETEARLGRQVHPTLYTREEFMQRLRAQNPFLQKVLAGRHVVLMGDTDDLAP